MFNGNNRKRRGKGTEEILETIMIENFPQINVRQQTTDSRKLKLYNIKEAKGKKPKQKNPRPRQITFKLQKIKD